MDKKDVIRIAEGLRRIEEGVQMIQDVMRSSKMKSIKEIADQLIPLLKEDDDAMNEDIVRHLS